MTQPKPGDRVQLNGTVTHCYPDDRMCGIKIQGSKLSIKLSKEEMEHAIILQPEQEWKPEVNKFARYNNESVMVLCLQSGHAWCSWEINPREPFTVLESELKEPTPKLPTSEDFYNWAWSCREMTWHERIKAAWQHFAIDKLGKGGEE